MTDILKSLGRGDRRSIGSAHEIVHKIRQNPHLFKKVFNGLYADDPIIRMRAADEVVKIIKVQIKTGSPAVQSRGRKLLQQIKKNN